MPKLRHSLDALVFSRQVLGSFVSWFTWFGEHWGYALGLATIGAATAAAILTTAGIPMLAGFALTGLILMRYRYVHKVRAKQRGKFAGKIKEKLKELELKQTEKANKLKEKGLLHKANAEYSKILTNAEKEVILKKLLAIYDNNANTFNVLGGASGILLTQIMQSTAYLNSATAMSLTLGSAGAATGAIAGEELAKIIMESDASLERIIAVLTEQLYSSKQLQAEIEAEFKKKYPYLSVTERETILKQLLENRDQDMANAGTYATLAAGAAGFIVGGAFGGLLASMATKVGEHFINMGDYFSKLKADVLDLLGSNAVFTLVQKTETYLAMTKAHKIDLPNISVQLETSKKPLNIDATKLVVSDTPKAELQEAPGFWTTLGDMFKTLGGATPRRREPQKTYEEKYKLRNVAQHMSIEAATTDYLQGDHIELFEVATKQELKEIQKIATELDIPTEDKVITKLTIKPSIAEADIKELVSVQINNNILISKTQTKDASGSSIYQWQAVDLRHNLSKKKQTFSAMQQDRGLTVVFAKEGANEFMTVDKDNLYYRHVWSTECQNWINYKFDLSANLWELDKKHTNSIPASWNASLDVSPSHATPTLGNHLTYTKAKDTEHLGAAETKAEETFTALRVSRPKGKGRGSDKEEG